MANNQEMYCEHCRRNTLFFWESDLLWYCDECGNVYGSIPTEEDDDFWDDEFEDNGFWNEDSEDDGFLEEDAEDGGFWEEDSEGGFEDGEVIKCRCCNNLIAVDELVDGYLCPICFDDLSGELEDFYEE